MLLLISILVYKNFNMDKYAMQNLHNFIFYLFIKLATCIVGFYCGTYISFRIFRKIYFSILFCLLCHYFSKKIGRYFQVKNERIVFYTYERKLNISITVFYPRTSLHIIYIK